MGFVSKNEECREQLTIALKAGRDVVGRTGGRLAVGSLGGAVALGASSGHASAGADPETTVLPYREPAEEAGFEDPKVGLAGRAEKAGLAAGGGAFFNAEMSTFPTGV